MKCNTSLPIIFCTLFVLLSCNSTKKETTDRKPNVIVIFMDDLGYGDLGVYGATGYETPNLDKMASQGMRFTNFYAAQAVCSASRAGLLTGCYPNRIGISGALFPYAKKGINSNETTIAEMVKDNGYATAIFGKWHLGDVKEFLPLQHGFDEFAGLPYSNDMWPVDYDGNPITDTTNWRFKRFPPLPFIEGNEEVRVIATLEDQAQLTTTYTEKAVDFIKRKKDEPFFLYVPHSMPHVPIAVSDKFKGKSEQGLYGDLMMELDWSVGQILQALKDNGIEDNTLVVYTSDNGPWLNFGNHAGSTGGLREGKGTSWEGGQREPCIMQWPGVIPEGKICNNIASSIDLLPTIAAITESKLPEHKIDGVNILSLLKGEKDADPRDHLYYYYGRNNLEGVRKGKWKLVFPHKHRSYRNNLPGNDGHAGSTTQVFFEETALYNLRRDPGEDYDVKELYPEVVKELEMLAEVARQDLGDDLTERKGANVRSAGMLTE
ncbi:sulfatase [Reichenbachiella sp. MALMAid0571]|uniref:sulfatase family protein n=1 Tax=Reichenbachiella sp. MALMAid0571 TaxID=3143939 RepID=UPI0032DFFA38